MCDIVCVIMCAHCVIMCAHCVSGIDAVRDGQQPAWRPSWLCGVQISNSVVGIYGRLEMTGIHDRFLGLL